MKVVYHILDNKNIILNALMFKQYFLDIVLEISCIVFQLMIFSLWINPFITFWINCLICLVQTNSHFRAQGDVTTDIRPIFIILNKYKIIR